MAETSSSLALEYILLGLLQAGPDHGYALFERIQSTPELSLIWQVKRSKLYYLLEKLAQDGFLALSISLQEGYPDRKVYHLTEAGKQAFEDWLLAPVHCSRHVRITFLSKLYFALLKSGSAAQDLIEAQLQVCQGWHQNLTGELDAIAPEHFIAEQVFRFRIGQVQAIIAWLVNCRAQIPAAGSTHPKHNKGEQ